MDGNLDRTSTSIDEAFGTEHLEAGSRVVDMFTDQVVGMVDDLHTFQHRPRSHEGRSLLVLCPADDPVEGHVHEPGGPSIRG